MNKTLEYYQGLQYRMVFDYDSDDNVYFVSFPELPGCLAHGETAQKALEVALKVKNEWLEMALKTGWDIPEPVAIPETSGRLTVRFPKYLHKKLIDRANVEGISQNQLVGILVAEGLQERKERPTNELVEELLSAINRLNNDKIQNINMGMQPRNQSNNMWPKPIVHQISQKYSPCILMATTATMDDYSMYSLKKEEKKPENEFCLAEGHA